MKVLSSLFVVLAFALNVSAAEVCINTVSSPNPAQVVGNGTYVVPPPPGG